MRFKKVPIKIWFIGLGIVGICAMEWVVYDKHHKHDHVGDTVPHWEFRNFPFELNGVLTKYTDEAINKAENESFKPIFEVLKLDDLTIERPEFDGKDPHMGVAIEEEFGFNFYNSKDFIMNGEKIKKGSKLKLWFEGIKFIDGKDVDYFYRPRICGGGIVTVYPPEYVVLTYENNGIENKVRVKANNKVLDGIEMLATYFYKRVDSYKSDYELSTSLHPSIY